MFAPKSPAVNGKLRMSDEVRRNLRAYAKQQASRREGATDSFKLIQMLVHNQPGVSAMEQRRKYGALIRSIVRVARENRQRIMSYLAPGVPAMRLP